MTSEARDGLGVELAVANSVKFERAACALAVGSSVDSVGMSGTIDEPLPAAVSVAFRLPYIGGEVAEAGIASVTVVADMFAS
jgi:hypothetical protein